MKNPSCTRTLSRPVRPVGPCRTGHSASTGQTARSDRLVPILAVNICPPCFFGKACLPKNILLSQNCLRAMINTTSAIFVLKAINNYRPCFAQVDVETTYLGRHTFFIVADVFGTASTCCSIASFLRIRCSLRFWVWDKPEGHHLGCKYFESCSLLFPFSLLQSTSCLTGLLLATIGLCNNAWFGYMGGYWI